MSPSTFMPRSQTVASAESAIEERGHPYAVTADAVEYAIFMELSRVLLLSVRAAMPDDNPGWSPQQVWEYIRDQANRPGCFDVSVVPCNDRLAYISPFD